MRPRRNTRHSALTVCKQMVSGSISFPSRGAFHLSLTVLVHYRSSWVFSLGEWSPQLPTGFFVPGGTQEHKSHSSQSFRIRGCHPLRPAFPERVLLKREFVTVRGQCLSVGCPYGPSTCVLQHPLYNAARYHVQRVWALPGSFATTTGIVSFLRGT
jgi:hypothetical protein